MSNLIPTPAPAPAHTIAPGPPGQIGTYFVTLYWPGPPEMHALIDASEWDTILNMPQEDLDHYYCQATPGWPAYLPQTGYTPVPTPTPPPPPMPSWWPINYMPWPPEPRPDDEPYNQWLNDLFLTPEQIEQERLDTEEEIENW
jgi:hypothetical protein